MNSPASLARRTRLLPLLLSIAAIALVGCIRAEVSIRVNDDGSGEVSVLAAFDEELFSELAADFGDESIDIDDPFGDLDEADLPPGASFEEYDEDGFRGARVTIPFEAGDNIAGSIDSALSGVGGDSDGLVGSDGAFESFQLGRDGDGWRFEAVAAPVNDDAGGEDTLGIGSGLIEALFGEASFEIKLALPGEVIEHNADRVEGDTLVWELGISSSEPRDLLAVTGASDDGGTNIVLIIIAVLVLLGIAASIIWFLMRTRAAAGI